MRYYFILILFVVAAAGKAQVREIKDYCIPEESKLNTKKALIPYKYDFGKAFRVTLKPHDQVKELALNLFGNIPYRFVFNSEGFPKDVRVLITDRDRYHRKAQVLWDSSGSETMQVFDIGGEEGDQVPGTVYIAIFIPALEDINPNLQEKGCINFMYGYKVF